MSSLSKFDFCPKCGALARDGVCQSCGYVNPQSVPKQPKQPEQTCQGQQFQGQQFRAQQYQTGFGQNAPAKSNTALITILVIIVVILGLLFTCCVGALSMYMMDVNVSTFFEEETKGVLPWEEDDEEEVKTPSVENKTESSKQSELKEEEMTKPTQDIEGIENGLYYEALYNAIRDDLGYGIEFKVGTQADDYDGRVTIQVEYPQLTGGAPNLDVINAYLEREYTYFIDYFSEQYEPYITEDSIFYVASQGYVTYMDEKVLSVVFQEEIYIDGESMIQYYCLNFDMTDGVVMNNVDILKLDLEFAVEFRRREIIENGDEWLTNYTDQEILELLRDVDHLVIFYTPMGMEVGLNLYEVVLYMTYSDYEKFLNLY